MSYIFGNTENYDHFMSLYIEGMVEEVPKPFVGCLVLYIDQDDNVIFVGRVIYGRLTEESDWTLVVQSKDLAEQPKLTALDVAPVSDVERIEFVRPPD